MMNFTETERPVSNSDLVEVERAFGFSFPAEFKEHYLMHNGGRPQNNLFKKEDTTFVVSEFLPIKYGNCLFEDCFRDLKVEREVFPEHLVGFAVDPGGDYYCFSVRDKDAGSIWFYRGEYYDEPERAVEFLAPSLNQFLESMVAEEE